MTKMRLRRIFAVSTGAGTDDVIFGAFMPGGTTMSKIKGLVQMHSDALIVNGVVAAAIEGWVLPVFDPDAATTMSALWDALVPKDRTDDVLDLDTGAADSASFYEGGAIVWEKVFDVGLQPKRVFHWHDYASFSYHNIKAQQDVETPFAEEWFAGFNVPIVIPRPIRVSQPSLLVFGVGSPLMDRTSATAPIAGLIENRWGQIKWIDHVMERAFLDLIGLTEGGAETPWEEASRLIAEHLDPMMLEADAGVFDPAIWFASGEVTMVHHVPGTIGKGMITTGR